jgi:DegV family protein with EDD domain
MEESKALAGRIRDTTGVVFAVETLEFLRRGGRIGGGAAFLATALNIKPILELRDGRVEAAEKVRTRRKSMERLVEIVKERAAGKTPLRLATLHANAEADARELLAEATAKLSPIETVFTSVSPVVGSHAGPGTVGLAWMAGV